jgi:hypothetical protein
MLEDEKIQEQAVGRGETPTLFQVILTDQWLIFRTQK